MVVGFVKEEIAHFLGLSSLFFLFFFGDLERVMHGLSC